MQEKFATIKALLRCKWHEGASVSVHVLKMKSYVDRLEFPRFPFLRVFATDIILNSLNGSYHQLILNYNMNNLDKILMELHDMLKTVEANMVKP